MKEMIIMLIAFLIYIPSYASEDFIVVINGKDRCDRKGNGNEFIDFFCDEKNIEKYEKIVKSENTNFANKYILTSPNGLDDGWAYLAVINPKEKKVYGLEWAIYSFVNNGRAIKSAEIIYSASRNNFCIYGSIINEASRSVNENSLYCYKFENEEFILDYSILGVEVSSLPTFK